MGMDVVGIDNDGRRGFFGDEASTAAVRQDLQAEIPSYRHRDIDIRDEHAIEEVFRAFGKRIAVVLHAAAQPSLMIGPPATRSSTSRSMPPEP